MFNTTQFLMDNFVNVDGVLGLLGKHFKLIPKREAVRKWFVRDSVSTEWMTALLYVVELETGSPVSIRKYFKEDNNNDIFG